MPDPKGPTELPAPKAGILSPTEVQEIISLRTGEDRILIPKLPGRVILPNQEVALTRSSDTARYYVQTKQPDGSWSCACEAGSHGKPCHHVKSLERYLTRLSSNSPVQHLGESMETFQRRQNARTSAEA